MRKQVAALEQSLKSARAKIGKTSAVDTGARLALSANALRQAVAGGRPYQAELERAKSLGADAKLLAPLAAFAATGLPGKSALAQELRALLPAMLKASGVQKAPAGFLERLEANASKIAMTSNRATITSNDASASARSLLIVATMLILTPTFSKCSSNTLFYAGPGI